MTRDFVYTHQEYTKVAKLVKNRHNVESSKIAVNQAKFIFYRKSRFFQNWRVKMPNFICGLNNFSEVVSPPIAICSRWLSLWENRLFHAKNSVIYQVFLTLRNSYRYVTLLNDKKLCRYFWIAKIAAQARNESKLDARDLKLNIYHATSYCIIHPSCI